MKKLTILLIFNLLLLSVFAQTPNAIKYQTVVRDGTGAVLNNQTVDFQISIIETSTSGSAIYVETFSTTTNQFGLVNLEIGTGTVGSGTFSTINWAGDLHFIKVEVDINDGNGLQNMGTSQLLSVPYALNAKTAENVFSGNYTDLTNQPAIPTQTSDLINNSGFITSPNDADADTTNEIQDLQLTGNTLKITNNTSATNIDLSSYSNLWQENSNDIYYNGGNVGVGVNNPDGKLIVKADAGMDKDTAIFEVKNKNGKTIFAVYEQGVRIYVDDSGTKANSSKAGFAVGGFNATKAITNEYFRVTPDSIRAYIESGPASRKAGFAVGGFNATKTTPDILFNIGASDSTDVIDSVARIAWYPQKEAFMAGRVIVQSTDSVGRNSFATGHVSKAIGDYSQAFGYRARAVGDNSTAIGDSAKSIGNNSYAFGNNAKSLGVGSYAIGTGAEANGNYSFAIGSEGNDLYGIFQPGAHATGNYSYAFGLGSEASGAGAISMGTRSNAQGNHSFASGFWTTASGDFSTTTGILNVASGYASSAMGTSSKAKNNNTVAIGYQSEAKGMTSFAAGVLSIAKSENEFVIGRYNDTLTSTSIDNWIPTDPLFIIGNGDISTEHNALMVLKNGNMGLNDNAPTHTLTINSSASPTTTKALRLIGPGTNGAEAYLNFGDGNYVYLHEYSDDKLRIHSRLSMELETDKLYIPGSYNDAVGVTNKALYIDDTGLIGYLSSSRRYKKQIKNMENTDWLYKLRPVNYLYKTDKKGIKQYGLIAEEVEKVNKLFVSYNKDGVIETVNYNMFISPIIKVIQEQKLEITKLKEENLANKNISNKNKNEIETLKVEIEQLKEILEVKASK